MSNRTSIEWCDTTWNPVTGCTKVSAGCKNCYAERIFNLPYPGRKFTDVRCHEDRLAQPLSWRKRRAVFVNSMSDLFHEDVPDEFIYRVFRTMANTPQHIYIVLTKRPVNMLSWCRYQIRRYPDDGMPSLGLPLPNVILGVSVEDQVTANQRIPLLLRTPAACRLVSYEPALEAVDFRRLLIDSRGTFLDSLTGAHEGFARHGSLPPMLTPLDWIIVGGESGPNARPFDVQWARDTICQCRDAFVPCFVKQIGSYPFDVGCEFSSVHGYHINDRKGGNWHEWPADLRVRESPSLPKS